MQAQPSFRLLLASILTCFLAGALAGAHAEVTDTLPDAPVPVTFLPGPQQTTPAPPQATPTPPPEAGPRPEHRSDTQTYRPSKWYGVVDPGEKVPALDKHDKMMFWVHESITPTGWFPIVYSAAYGQLVNNDPKYGTDSAAFGERFGAAALRVTSFRFFSDSLVPTITREDPRYFRMAYGSVWHRGWYAATRAVVTRRDSGETTANYSTLIGHAAGSALTLTYYPHVSANGTVVAETFGWAMLGQAGGNLFLEFWPDVRDAIFKRHRMGIPVPF